jgi:metallo-beta-lactamase class B
LFKLVRGTTLAALALLVACATPQSNSPSPPLASEEDLVAAEQAPLGNVDRQWNTHVAPFTVIGNIHYVGVEGLSSFLITTPSGHFLLDGGLPQTAPQIIANIERLGYRIEDVRYLLNSHAHYDHAGGLARLQRESGAEMIASAADRAALEAGRFPYGPSASVNFPPVRVDRVIADGETLRLGGVVLTAHLTPGHTPGCTSWSMDVIGADGVRRRVLFHCSTTVAGQSLSPPAYPAIVADFEQTFRRLRDMNVDVLLTNHPGFADLAERRARQLSGDANAFVDPAALDALNDALERAFREELARQQARN